MFFLFSTFTLHLYCLFFIIFAYGNLVSFSSPTEIFIASLNTDHVSENELLFIKTSNHTCHMMSRIYEFLNKYSPMSWEMIRKVETTLR